MEEDVEKSIHEDNNPSKPIEPPAKVVPPETPGVAKLRQ